MSTRTKNDFMTVRAYEEARTLPEAIQLNRDFIRHEREFCRRHLPADRDCLDGLASFSDVLTAALVIWHEEMAKAYSRGTLLRIAQRIREELPSQDNYGDIATCVETGDYTPMAC